MGQPPSPARIAPFFRVSEYWQRERGCRIGRLPVQAGFTCPNRDGRLGKDGCAWCNNLAFSPVAARTGARDVAWQVRDGLVRAKLNWRYVGYLVYFQPYSNTYAPLEHLQHTYEQAFIGPEIVGIAVATRPDCLDDAVIRVLAGFLARGKVWLELGLQTAHDDTLAAMGRGHTFADFVSAATRAAAAGLEVIVHLILGLPGEGREKNEETIRKIRDLPLQGIKFHHLQVLRDTRMEEWYRQGKVACDTRESYRDKLIAGLELLPPSWVVHRLMGEAAPGYLVAPLWETGSGAFYHHVEEEMLRRGTYQGKQAQG